MTRRAYPRIVPVRVDGERRWQATCSACGADVCSKPQPVKAAVEEARRWHGLESECTRHVQGVHPCEEHASINSPDLPWHRALDIATDCPRCEVLR